MKKHLIISFLATFIFIVVACKSTLEEGKVLPKENTKLAIASPSNFPALKYDFSKNSLTKEGFELGRKLFYDGILSRDGTISCGECHRQEYAFTHHQHDVSHGIDNQLGERNAPTIQNMAWIDSFFWDGGVHDLDLVPIAAIESPLEMGEKLGNVLEKLRKSEKYPSLFENAFGSKDITTATFLKALSQFVVSLTATNSKYDKYIRNEVGSSLATNELEGMKLFQQKCSSCHAGALFSDQSYRNNGLTLEVKRQVVENDKVITKSFKDEGRFRITEREEDRFKFRVPSLRNIAVTRPYMHDGRFWTLEEVLNHYSDNMKDNGYVDVTLKNNGKIGISLTSDEKANIIAFLNTLTDKQLLFDSKFSEQ